MSGQVLRRLQARVLDALGDTPVVCLAGASRVGKTELVRALQAELPGASCHRFADPATLARAAADPARFLAELPALALLDDADRIPGLLPLLRPAVDRGGRFLLTCAGTLPGLAETLAWRMEPLTLWPLAQAELQGVHPGLIDACFQGEPERLRLESLDRGELLGRVLAGGYPEVQGRSAREREAWFHGYLDTLVQARLRIATDLRSGHQLSRMLAAPGADPGPARRCQDLLEGVQVLAALPARSGPRYRCCSDAALQAHLLGMAPAALETRPVLAAPLLETFAVMELVKTAPWSQSRPALSVLGAGPQPLLVLEDHRRNLVAFAVDASATVSREAFQGLRDLRAQAGNRFRAGLVLHPGEALVSAGPGLWSAPFQALWAARAATGG